MKRFKRLLFILGPAGTVLLIGFYFVWMRSIGPTGGDAKYPEGSYAWRAPMPKPRTESGGVAMGERLYVLGGINEFAQSFRDFWSYDTNTDTWERLPDFPIPINHPAVTTDGHYVYVIGGFAPLGLRLRFFMFVRWDAYQTLFRYDAASRNWQQLADMPAARGAGGAAYGDGKLWYVGGINEQRLPDSGLYAYDIAADRWETLPPMQQARDHLRAEYIDDALFAISGREDDLRKNYGRLERYDVSSGTWSDRAPIPTPRGGFASAVADGRIFTFGGEALWSCFEEVEVYDPETDAWSRFPDLPEGRHGIIAGVVGRNIHLVTGGRHPRLSISGLHRVLMLPAEAK